MLREAKSPVIIAGSGAYYAEAGQELKAFCELTKIPVFTKFMGRGLMPDNDPHCLGSVIPTGLGVLPNCDVILILGARLDFTMLFGKPPIISEDAKFIQVDIDGSEIGRNRKVDLGLVGDIREVLKGMIDLATEDPFSHGEWLESVGPQANDTKELMLQGFLASEKEEPINPIRLMQEINDFLSDDAIVVADGGDTQFWTIFVRNIYEPGHLLSSGNFGCLGVGIPFALAAKLRYPEKQVLVTMGDGSAGLNLMEFNTAIRFGLPIVMVISNDCSWGMIRHSQNTAYGPGRTIGCELGEVPYEKVVEALGGYGERVNRVEEIKPALERAFASKKPACLNVYTDRDIGSPFGQDVGRHWIDRAAVNQKMSIVLVGRKNTNNANAGSDRLG